MDWLVKRPDVDPERVGTLGMSMGSTMAWWLAALDERVRVTVDINCLTDFQALIAHKGLRLHGIYYYVPSLLEHFTAAARACAPLPFYVYEFAITSGYAVPPDLVRRLREQVTNLAGLKVSDRTWEELEGYLIEGLDVFVGFEGLIAPARANGAVGAVSALASAFPEIVAAAVRGEDVDPGALRAQVDRYPRHAALKHVLVRRGVPIREDVRAPLRGLTAAERTELDAELDQVFQAA